MKKVFSMFVVVVLVIHTLAFTKKEEPVYTIGKGIITFKSNAKLELINASSNKIKGIINPVSRSCAFYIDIITFDGFNSPLQKEHFNENYIETNKYPRAVFVGRIIEEEDFSKDGIYSLRAKGKFTLHGVEQERIIKGEIIVKNGILKLKSIFTVLLNDHNIKIPRIVHEKLDTEIKVEINADFIKK